MTPIKIHNQLLGKAKVKFLTLLSHLKDLCRIWDLRVLILVSLGLQVILMTTAPFRKKTASKAVVSTVWLAYLLADYIAIQAVGLIPKYHAASATETNATHPDILAFWAAFLLVHLGGPDLITALALEDNELWLRTALHFCTYVSASGRVFFQSLPSNLLYLPTMLMFVVGIVKYLERALSFYYARLTRFKSSILTLDADTEYNSAELMDSYESYLTSNLPESCSLHYPNNESPEPETSSIYDYADDDESFRNNEPPEMERRQSQIYDYANKSVSDESPSNKKKSNCGWFTSCLQRFRRSKETRLMSNVILVRDAYVFFQKYKGLYVDLSFSLHDRNRSRNYFLRPSLTPKDAFTVLEIELNFAYEVFFTKMILIHRKTWICIRYACFPLQVLSLLIWILFIDKRPFHSFDIGITYTLLLGAIIIDLMAFLAITLSDWKVATLDIKSKTRVYLYDKLLSARSKTSLLFKRLFFRRWSESIFQFNLIGYCLSQRSDSPCIPGFLSILQIKEYYEWVKYVPRNSFDSDLRDFIFSELKHRAEMGDDPKDVGEICDSKGDWALRTLAASDFDPFLFYKWTVDVEYDKCLLIWHIATDLLYETLFVPKEREEGNLPVEEDKPLMEEGNLPVEEDNPTMEDGNLPVEEDNLTMEEEGKQLGEEDKKPMEDGKSAMKADYRKYCKILSDYMMYLLKWQPGMMSVVAGTSEVRFRDTRGKLTILLDMATASKREAIRQNLHQHLMTMDETQIDTKGDRNKSVLLDGVRLAKMLKNVKGLGMWELIAKVWVDLLGYSAMRCRASAHAAQLKQGGELLTMVWLLMVHFGLGKQFSITEDNN